MSVKLRTYRDNFGLDILPTDTVIVSSYGYGARLVDTGTRSKVVRYTPTRVVINDSDGNERAVDPHCLQIMRRDGSRGFEGNAVREREEAAKKATPRMGYLSTKQLLGELVSAARAQGLDYHNDDERKLAEARTDVIRDEIERRLDELQPPF